VPKDTEDYFTTISSPMDYGSIQSKLEAAGYPATPTPSPPTCGL